MMVSICLEKHDGRSWRRQDLDNLHRAHPTPGQGGAGVSPGDEVSLDCAKLVPKLGT
jgi:hypothetical protein